MRNIKTINFTKEGYEKLKKDKESLQEERKGAVKTLSEARELGDLSENGLYKAARARLSSIDHSIGRIEYQLKVAKIANKPAEGVIGIGNRVILQDQKGKHEFFIVGDFEAQPKEGKISSNSPLGRKLMGRKLGDNITVDAPLGKISYKIIKVV